MIRLAVAAIIKNEAPYIAEWIEHHLAEGVDYFFLYDNESTDNLREVLRPYKPWVHTIDWPVHPGQKLAYSHALDNFGTCGDIDWIAFIDADEFLYARTDKSIKEILSEYEHAGAVAVNWLMFGSNGHTYYSDEPVVKRFTKRASTVNPHVKSIVHTGMCASVGNDVHTFFVEDGPVVNEAGMPVGVKHYALSENPRADLLAINHYHTKSREEYRERCYRARADTGGSRDFDSSFDAHDANDVVDEVLYRKRGYGNNPNNDNRE